MRVTEHYFAFFRRRLEKVESHAQAEDIEAVILWGAAIDALTKTRAMVMKSDPIPVGSRFVRELRALCPLLGTVSIPLLAHELVGPLEPSLPDEAEESQRAADEPGPRPALEDDLRSLIDGYRRRVGGAGHWHHKDDLKLVERVKTVRENHKGRKPVFDRCEYAHILYESYRCPAVHEGQLGWRATTLVGFTPHPSGIDYQNTSYGDGDPLPREHRIRSPIAFLPSFLVGVLKTVIDKFEQECQQHPLWPVIDVNYSCHCHRCR